MSIDGLNRYSEFLPLNNDSECFQKATGLLLKIRPNWKEKNIIFTLFTAGITNKIFCCTESQLNESIVVRVYGANSNLVIDRHKEFSNWIWLNRHKFAAPLYAIFDNGLIYGYLPGKTLNVESVKYKPIVSRITNAIAAMHSLPLTDLNSSTDVVLFTKMRQYIANAPDRFNVESKQKRMEDANYWSKNQLLAEVERMQKVLEPLESPIVFCHNDLLIHNIIHNDETEKISFIDYEYSGCNYQAFDIANHFCEYAGVVNFDYERYPSRSEQLIWLEEYLTAFLRRKPTEIDIERLYVQTNKFAAASHFFWSLWAVIQGHFSTIDFDFVGYAIVRLEEYQKLKERYFALELP